MKIINNLKKQWKIFIFHRKKNKILKHQCVKLTKDVKEYEEILANEMDSMFRLFYLRYNNSSNTKIKNIFLDNDKDIKK